MSRGFTLIEAIVYLALLSLIMVGALATTYELLQGASRVDSRNVAAEEGNFVLRKLDWAMGGAQAVIAPSSGNWASSARILRYDGTIVELCVANDTIWIRRTGAFIGTCGDVSNGYASTTTSNVKVSALGFYHIPSAGSGPEGLDASTTVNGTSFGITRYIRK